MSRTHWRTRLRHMLAMGAAALVAISSAPFAALAADAAWARIEQGAVRMHEGTTQTLGAVAPAGATLVWQARQGEEGEFAPLEGETSASLELEGDRTDLDGAWIRVQATLPNGDVQSSVPVLVQRVGHALRKTQALSPGCEAEGNLEYWTCSLCGKHFRDSLAEVEAMPEDLRVPATGHTFEYVPEVSPTADRDGCRAHWKCTVCHRTYKDQPAKEELSREDLFISRLGHTYVISVAEATCATGGHITYACNHCANTYVAHEEGPLGHDLMEMEGQEPTETQAGVTRHWVCRRCGKLFSDENGNVETTADQLIRPATGHTFTSRTVEPTCTEPGYTLSTCSTCGFVEKSGDMAPLGHDLEHVPAKAPTCQEGGNKAHWKCRRCGQIIGDQDVELPRGDHKYVDAVTDATCTEGGYTEHVCSVCGDAFRDSETAATGHSLVLVERVEPTADEPGSIRHYRCERCGALFEDEEETTPLDPEDIVIPRLQGPPANTQDTQNVWLWACVAMAAAVCLVLVVRGRKRHARTR